MAERHPTNEQIVELLRQLEHEVRELKEGQQQLTSSVRNLTESLNPRS